MFRRRAGDRGAGGGPRRVPGVRSGRGRTEAAGSRAGHGTLGDGCHAAFCGTGVERRPRTGGGGHGPGPSGGDHRGGSARRQPALSAARLRGGHPRGRGGGAARRRARRLAIDGGDRRATPPDAGGTTPAAVHRDVRASLTPALGGCGRRNVRGGRGLRGRSAFPRISSLTSPGITRGTSSTRERACMKAAFITRTGPPT